MVRLPRFLGAFRIHHEQKTTATADVGDAECARLRQRVHGRTISTTEMRRRMKPYFLRHILVHKRQRLIDRLPLRRHRVRTVPEDSWLLARGIGADIPEGRGFEDGDTVAVSAASPPEPSGDGLSDVVDDRAVTVQHVVRSPERLDAPVHEK